MIHNNKVYANADEKFVKGTIIHSDSGTGLLYHDAEFTIPVYTDEMEELFLNGVIIRSNGGFGVTYHSPSDCTMHNGQFKTAGGTYTAQERPTE